MPGSNAVAVRSAVIAGLTTAYAALDAFNGVDDREGRVECSYAYDRRSNAAERVFTANARAETPPAGLRSGRNYRNESGEFDLVVLAAYVGGSAEDADTRAFAIGEVAEEWIGDRKSNELGIAGLTTLTVRGWDAANLGNDHGHMTELTYRVAWTTRIT